MKFDIITLSFVLFLISMIQAIGIYSQVRMDKGFHGIKLWFWGNLLIGIGVFTIYLRYSILHNLIFIMMSNSLIIGGNILIYVGILRFLGKRENIRILACFYMVSMIGFYYFTYINENINFRMTIYSFTYAIIAILIALELLRNKKASTMASAKPLGILILLFGLFFIMRGILTLFIPQGYSFFHPSLLQAIMLMASIACGYLWSFGLIILLNQRVNLEKQAAQERFQLIFETSPDMVLISSLERGIIVEANEKFTMNTGYSKEEAIGATTTDLQIWSNEDDRVKFVQQLLIDGHKENYEQIITKKDGTIFTGLISSNLMNLNGMTNVISVIRNIEDRKQIEETLKNRVEKIKVLSQAVEQSPVSIVITDMDGSIEYINKKFIEITGYSYEEVIGENPRVLKSGYHTSEFYKGLWDMILSNQEWSGEFYNKKKNGEHYWESARISPIANDSGELVQLLAIKEDITERKHLEYELQMQAQTDMLTGIPNRRHFIEALENELSKNIRHPKESAFLMLDIDHFKQTNDNFGHGIGDIALKMVAQTFKDTLRSTDIYGRIGGEEFAIFLVETNLIEAKNIAERIRLNVQEIKLFNDHGTPVPIRISIGISEYRLDGDTMNGLMTRADEALYKAKSEGRNRVVIEQEVRENEIA